MARKAIGIPSVRDNQNPGVHLKRWTVANAEASWYSLEKILARLPVEIAPEPLLAAAQQNRRAILQRFREQPALGRQIQQFHMEGIWLTFQNIYSVHPEILTNIASFLAVLIEHFGPIQEMHDRSVMSLGLALDRLVFAVREQVRSLAQVNKLAKHICATLQPSKIALIEFPVGNSIATKLMGLALQAEGYVTETHTACLSRNDSRQRGKTRQELLAHQLRSLLDSNTPLYLYADEWISGTNFDYLCAFLEKIARKSGARLAPIGLLSNNATIHSRYVDFVAHHNKRIKSLTAKLATGIDPAAFRIAVPAVLGLDAPFFWSENTRLCGYIKYQLLGSIIDAFDDAGALLLHDRAEFERALFLFLVHMATLGKRVTPNELADDPSKHHEFFRSSYEGYVEEIRDRLLKIEHPTNTDPFSIISTPPSLADLIEDVAKGSRAYYFMLVVGAYLAHTYAYESPERYPITTHTPICQRITDLGALLHDMLIERLFRSVQVMSVTAISEVNA